MSEPYPQDLTGRRLGHFRVDGVIGRGGMSTLYRATDTRLGRRVALKVIDEALAADREFRDRFVDEARNTSAVDHSHVVPLYDFDETDGHLYIAMRFVEGPDLASVVGGRPLAPGRAIRLLEQVAQALDAVHARGLVHLDVKPANVLVTTRESAGGEHVYLADFGLTRRGATGHRTSGGDFLGSPTYAAPEHLRGEPVDARTDVYSLTCVLFTCLTGRAPYVGSVPEVIDGHLGGTVPSASALAAPGSPLDPRVDAVVHRGLDPDPPRRFASAREVVEAARVALLPVAGAPVAPPVPASRRPDPSGPHASGPHASGPHASGPHASGPHPEVSGPRRLDTRPDPSGPRPDPSGPGAGLPVRTPTGAMAGPAGATGAAAGGGRFATPPGPPPYRTPPGPLTRSSVAPPMRLRDPVQPRDGSFTRGRTVPTPLVVAVGAGLLLVLLGVLLLVLV